MQIPKFAQPKPSFHTELKRRINEYFNQTGKSTAGNYKLWGKALILLVAYILLYIHLVFFTPSITSAIVECIVFGLVTAAIGFNIMHDGAHGSFSKYPLLNKMAAVTLGFLGGSHFMWNVKHNIIHHAYTNIDGIDDDIDAKPFFAHGIYTKEIQDAPLSAFIFLVLLQFALFILDILFRFQ